MGWLADAEYSYWQNAQDPLQYRAAGRDFEHLPRKSNGLPYPLEQSIIDVSSNPGRRILRHGYIETVGSVMWLGQAFWELVNSSRNTINELKWAKIEKWESGVIRIEAAAEPFVSSEGEARQKQMALRNAIFSE
jgi:hypothetical protein